ncbi:flagellar filament capping protein FliD [uncultured Sphingomonas sp.]|uniref:flagellar filament capping protein FliD n=1 Tax=uncultured Sphingomonas sp. TaxID=158754 RepID=UPI002588A678|nr:flagellar filament capping protein FliD [uncultured Sphingomonas sp.]
MAITTTSATASATTAKTSTTTTTKATTPNLANALGAGSGVDTTALVKSLVDAQFANRNARLTRQAETLTAQVSAVSELKSGITEFATALTALAESGGLTTQLSSSGPAVKASLTSGAKVTSLNASVSVARLASPQVAVTKESFSTTGSVGSGTIQLQLGSVDANGKFTSNGTAIPAITITASDATSLQKVADKITAAKAGVTASVVTDANGQRLVMRSTDGANQAFTVTATNDSGSTGLERLNVDFDSNTTDGAEVVTRAGNAVFSVDGVPMVSASNTITGADGVKLELKAVTTDGPVTLSSSTPTDALKEAVNNVVAAYNQMLTSVNKATDPITGDLRADPAAMAMKRSLQKLTLTDLTGAKDGSPTTLASIGIATNNDGSLRVDAKMLSSALANNPGAVEAMFAAGTGSDGTTGTSLPATLNRIAATAKSTTLGLGASDKRYAGLQADLAKEQAKVAEQTEVTSTRMTQQFAASEARVAAYKARQTFMENQIKMWTRSE